MLNDDFLGIGTVFSVAIEAVLLKDRIRFLCEILLGLCTLIPNDKYPWAYERDQTGAKLAFTVTLHVLFSLGLCILVGNEDPYFGEAANLASNRHYHSVSDSSP